MPTERTILIYKFEELSDKAKERAREWWREFPDAVNLDFVLEDAETIGEMLGIEFKRRTYQTVGGETKSEPCIFYSGFSSQGDGASFEGTYRYVRGKDKLGVARRIKKYAPKDTELHRIAEGLQDHQRNNQYKIVVEIDCNNSRYSHSASMLFENLSDLSEDKFTGFAFKDVCKLLRSFADWIYKQLEKEYEWQMSDEAVDETIISNEYDFDVEGKRI